MKSRLLWRSLLSSTPNAQLKTTAQRGLWRPCDFLNARCYSTPTNAIHEKPYYVTTPIFYVNAAPHIGHLYTLILTDVLKRWQVLQGRKAILCTGTDEHGMKVCGNHERNYQEILKASKIERAASEAGQDVRAFCDQNYKSFEVRHSVDLKEQLEYADPLKVLAQRANIDNDHFIRTSEPDHRFAVQHFWLMLKERGYIYTSKHEGWYAVSDETFYPASGVQLNLEPSTGRKFMASVETGKEVEWTSENNYHFRLSAFKNRLLEYYASNPKFVVPATRMNDVVQAVTAGLDDLSISRPVERLSWGIPVPDDETQTIYVWLDALINYLTKANYPFQLPGKEDAAGWPADCQVIGKDIVRFHCIYWPAFLMALDLPLPYQVLTHAHWTLSHQKMSKSTGNVVNPFFALDRFGVETMRYYLIYDGGIRDDADYENSYIIKRYRKGLQGGLGNLASRIVRGKGWSVKKSVEQAVAGKAPAEGSLAETHRILLMSLPGQVTAKFEALDSGAALKEIMNAVYATNRYMQHTQPWDLVGNPQELENLNSIIYLCAESLRICGILLQPYMPDTMKRLLDMLGVASEARKYENTLLGSDLSYGKPTIELGRGTQGVLFPPLRSHS
ncbi:methionyl-tRNA synthetase [Xylographa trunciseda]|nr:methionyl-tRNA synthetase [Xylographa trunciseda]